METLRKQPLLTFCLFFVISSFVFYYLDAVTRIILISLTTITAIFSCFFIRYKFGIYKKSAVFIIIILLGISLAGLRQQIHYDFNIVKAVSLAESEAEITVVIEKVNYKSSFSATYTVNITSVNDKKTNLKAILKFNNEYDADINDILSLSAKFSLPEENQNGFPLRRYYASKNIHIVAESNPENVNFIGKNQSVKGFFAQLSDKLSAKLKLSLGDEAGGLSSGILLGRRNDISDATRRDFRFLGISHILSVSGLHLTIIVGGFFALMYFLKINKVIRFILSAVLILFFMFLTGFTSSVVRSGIMMLLVETANLLGKKDSPILSLFFSGTVITIFSPNSVADVGFLLSFSATLGLLTLGKKFYSIFMKGTRKKVFIIRLVRKSLASIGVTLSALIFTLPFTYYYFGEISLITPISNLIFVPLSGIFLLFSIAVLLFPFSFIAPLLCGATKLIANFIIDLSSYFTLHINEPISLNYGFTIFAFIFALISCIIVLITIKKKNIFVILIPFAVWISVFSVCYFGHLKINAGITNIIAVNLKKNDYILLNDKGKTLICDFSDGRQSQLNNANSLISKEFSDTSADALLLTHLHSYHVSTFSEFADNNKMDFLIIPDGYDEKTEDIVYRLKEVAKTKNVEVICYSNQGDTVFFSSCEINISQISFIKRSTQPLSFLSINTGKGSFSYFPASLFESELSQDARKTAEISSAVWYGIHGPNIKSKLDGVLTDADVVVSNATVNELYKTNFNEVNDVVRAFLKFQFR